MPHGSSICSGVCGGRWSRRTRRQSRQIENRNDALVSLEAEVAQTYSQLRGAQLLKQITLAEIDSERDTDLTREQARVGLTSRAMWRARLRRWDRCRPSFRNSMHRLRRQ